MDKKKNGIPKLRFPGFTGAWEQRKLGKILSYEQPGPYIVNSDNYDNKFNVPVLTAGKSFILGFTNEVKGIKKASESDPVIIFDDFTTGSHYVDFPFKVKSSALKILSKTNEKIDTKFIYEVLSRINYVPQSHERHWISQFSKFNVMIPTSQEQEKVGNFLKRLDHLIALHQRKLDHLKEQKTGLLQKMFPKKEEVVPEVRFPGFTDAWEQRKLGEVASYRNGKAHEKDISESGKYIVINSKFVSSNGTVRKYSNKMIAPLNKGEISFVLSDVPNGKALARTFLTDQDDTYTLNQRIAGILPKQGVNSYFMSTLMNRNSYFLKFNDGVGQTNLSKRDVTEWKAFYPSHAEQKKIGGFLQQFDSLIALHQRKLDHLQLLKKGLLQQMFV